MMGHREPMISGDEFDAFHRYSRRNFATKPGLVRKVKQRFNRRVRHQVKAGLQSAR